MCYLCQFVYVFEAFTFWNFRKLFILYVSIFFVYMFVYIKNHDTASFPSIMIQLTLSVLFFVTDRLVLISGNCDTARDFLLLPWGIRFEDYLPNPSFCPVPTVCSHHVSSPGLLRVERVALEPFPELKWLNISTAGEQCQHTAINVLSNWLLWRINVCIISFLLLFLQ